MALCVTQLASQLQRLSEVCNCNPFVAIVLMLNLFPTITEKFLVMIETNLSVFGSCERHSELTEKFLVHVNLI